MYYKLLNEKMKERKQNKSLEEYKETKKKESDLSVSISNGTLRANPFTRAILFVKEKSFQQSGSLSTTHTLGKILECVACWLDFSNMLSIANPVLLSSGLVALR